MYLFNSFLLECTILKFVVFLNYVIIPSIVLDRRLLSVMTRAGEIVCRHLLSQILSGAF